MIVRITRAKVRRNSEAHAFETLRAISRDVAKPDGLEGLLIGRRSGDDENELVAISMWSDVERLRAAFGDNFDRPAFGRPLEEFVTDPTVELYETVVASWSGLEHIAE
jgi:heme-degrading monooxygenase HmoA